MIPLLVAIGGALGSVARWSLTQLLTPRGAGSFPVGTLVINITGSFLLGFLYVYFDQAMSPRVRLFAGTGFCGGFTTFSTFSYDAVSMFQEGDYARAWFYVGASVICSLIGAYCGMLLGKAAVHH